MFKAAAKGQVSRVIFCAAVLCVAWSIHAQTAETYKVRLSPVPIDVAMMSRIAGTGSLTAVLTGKKLTINGSFQGLKSPATDAHIHHGAKGIPGPAILDLPVSKGTSGTLSASVDLTPEQVEELRKSNLYIQINSQGAPDGNLWGWLLR